MSSNSVMSRSRCEVQTRVSKGIRFQRFHRCIIGYIKSLQSFDTTIRDYISQDSMRLAVDELFATLLQEFLDL